MSRGREYAKGMKLRGVRKIRSRGRGYATRTKLRGSAKNKEQREGVREGTPIFCSRQAFSFARVFDLRLERKGKERAATQASRFRLYTKVCKTTFIRRISAVSTAIQTIDNEANHLIPWDACGRPR